MEQQLSPNPVEAQVLLDFPSAIAEIIKGNTVTRLAWNDINEYGVLASGWLTIHTKGAFHTWSVNDGDLLATDWVVREQN